MKKQKPEMNIFGHCTSRRLLKRFSDKILLGSNMTLYWKYFLKTYLKEEGNESFKVFKFFIFGLPVFFLIKIFG